MLLHEGDKTGKCRVLRLGTTLVLFSYETPIALYSGDRSCRLANSWGPTTGRHFNQARNGLFADLEIVGTEEFERRLAGALMDYVQTLAVLRLAG